MTRRPNAFQQGLMFLPSLCLLLFACVVGCATDPMHQQMRFPRDTSRDPVMLSETETSSTPAVVPASHNATNAQPTPEQPESYAVARSPTAVGP